MFLRINFSTHGILLPASYTLFAWLLNYFLGFISLEHLPTSIAARDAGAAFTLPLMTGLLWWGKSLCLDSGAKNLSKVISHRRRTNIERLSHLLSNILGKKLQRFSLRILSISILISFTYLYSEGLFFINDTTKDTSSYRFILLIQAIPFWISILYFITSLVLIYRLTHSYLAKYWRVRLFEIEVMIPICNMVVTNFLVSALLIAVYPLNTLFVTLPDTDQKGLLLFSCLAAGLLFYPIILVQQAIKKRKEQTLFRINHSLNNQLDQPTAKQVRRRLVDDDVRLQFIADLLVVRKEVHRAPMWPMNTPFTLKMGLILMLPLASWIGAGVISQLLKPWIQ